MKRYKLFGIACLSLALSSCAFYTGINAQVNKDLSDEKWIPQLNTDPNKWVQNQDSWFVTGNPSKQELADKRAPYSAAITTSIINVPDFDSLKLDGRFHVQIIGHQDHNSTFVYGPNEAIRQVLVDIKGKTVSIHEAPDNKANYMDKVIVRIGVKNLNHLSLAGNVQVEGREIYSDHLSIKNTSNCYTMLAGNMVLAKVNQAGSGAILINGAYTPKLSIISNGSGAVNISGRVGVDSIVNNGGEVNIIGADSDYLSIATSRFSKTTIAGYVNIKELSAKHNSQVYIYWSNSNGAYFNVYDRAIVGVAGAIRSANIEVSGGARFFGEYLRAENVFVKTHGWGHANVNPGKKMFASAMESSSIYFFGTPTVLSRYTSNNGTVLPVWSDTPNLPSTILPPPTTQSTSNNTGDVALPSAPAETGTMLPPVPTEDATAKSPSYKGEKKAYK